MKKTVIENFLDSWCTLTILVENDKEKIFDLSWPDWSYIFIDDLYDFFRSTHLWGEELLLNLSSSINPVAVWYSKEMWIYFADFWDVSEWSLKHLRKKNYKEYKLHTENLGDVYIKTEFE